MRKIISILSICTLILIALSISLKAENNEKSIILNSSSLGDWAKAKKIKKSGKVTLEAWGPYVDYTKTIPIASLKDVMLKHIDKINIDYDEIWVWERNDLFTPAEKNKYKGQFDIHKIYWKGNKIQAFTLEKYYISNPITKKKLGKHKITQVG